MSNLCKQSQKFLQQLQEGKTVPRQLLETESYRRHYIFTGEDDPSDSEVEMEDCIVAAVEEDPSWAGECEVHLRQRLLEMKKHHARREQRLKKLIQRHTQATMAMIIHHENQISSEVDPYRSQY